MLSVATHADMRREVRRARKRDDVLRCMAPPLCHPLMTLHSAAASFVPTSISNCVIWLTPTLGVTLTSGRVSTWADQSGSGNDFTQATAGNRPIPATNINSQTTIHFDRSRPDSLAKASFSAPSAGELFIVTKNGDTAQNGLMRMSSAGAGVDSYYPFTGGTTWDIYENALQSSRVGPLTATTALTNAHVYNIRSDGTASGYIVAMDGTAINTSTATVGFGTTLTLGSNVSVPISYTGDIGDVILYSRVLNSTERANVMAYLRGIYATP